jgi:peptidoglycan/LPS O-acetylase OafA/YrhL
VNAPLRDLKTSGGQQKFEGIETGRGIAAILVVFHHAGHNIAEPRFFGLQPFGSHLENFNVGIDFFFVLSGFIIAWIHWQDIGQTWQLKRYATRRFLRIYPPYWGVAVPLIIMYLLFPGAGKPSQHDPLTIAFSLALLPYVDPPVLGAAWTLVHEVLFYAIFGAIILLGRRWVFLLFVWGALIVGAQIAEQLRFPASILLSPFNLEFLFGIAAASWIRANRLPAPWLFLLGGTACFFALMLFATTIQDNTLVARLAFGLSSACVILGLVQTERDGHLRVSPVFRFLGAASYSIYLIHGVALSFASQLAIRIFPKSLPPVVPLMFLVCVGIASGLLYHVYCEKRLMGWFRRLIGQGSKEQAQRSA